MDRAEKISFTDKHMVKHEGAAEESAVPFSIYNGKFLPNVKPIFTIGIKHKKNTADLYNIMKKYKMCLKIL